MTKKSEPNLMANLPSGPVLAVLGGAVVCLLLIVGIFMPGGLLDSLVGNPQVAETPVEQPVEQTEQQVPLPEALRPEKNIAFLAENAKKTGVKTTASGLQYKVLKATKGKQPGPTSTVSVNYVGKMIDGTQFDASREAPAEFSLDGVIPGWTEGLQLMHEGEKVEFVIPQDLAYGPQGKGPIPPLQTLVFQVELLKVQ